MSVKDFLEPEKYDLWYDEHKSIYKKELKFIKKLLGNGDFIEIGAGTGRFGGELSAIALIELSDKMIKFSLNKGYEYVKADAVHLPLRKESVKSILFAFSLSFIRDPARALKEAFDAVKNKIVIVDLDPRKSKNYINDLKSNYRSYNSYFIKSVKKFDKKMKIYNLSFKLGSQKIILIGFIIFKEQGRK